MKKRQRRLRGVDEIVLSLSAQPGRSARTSPRSTARPCRRKESVSPITDRVPEEMATLQNGPMDEICAPIFIDAIVVKIPDGQVTNRPIYRGHWRHFERGEGRPGVCEHLRF